MRAREIVQLLSLASLSLLCIPCRAELKFTLPLIGDVVGAGKYTVHAREDGVVPTHTQMNATGLELVLFTGNDSLPHLVKTYDMSTWKITDPTTQFPQIGITNTVGPNLKNLYFLAYRAPLLSNSSIWITTYSDRFTLTNMTGDAFSSTINAANAQITTSAGPSRMISCGGKSAKKTCDEDTLRQQGLLGTSTTSLQAAEATASTVTLEASKETGTGTAATAKKKGSAGGGIKNKGLIVAIVLGVAAFLLLLGVAVFFIMRARRKDKLAGGYQKRREIAGWFRKGEREEVRLESASTGKHESRLQVANPLPAVVPADVGTNTAVEMGHEERNATIELDGEERRLVAEMPGSGVTRWSPESPVVPRRW